MGEAGELVITTLTKQALPMVRLPHPQHHAPLGRALRLWAHSRAHHACHRTQ
jgi:hypothetical protein